MMRPLFLTFALALFVLFGAPGRAAILHVTQAPDFVTVGQVIHWELSIEAEPGEEIYSYQFNVGFSDWLTPGPVTEVGYFATNGVFFFPGVGMSDSIVYILNSLSGADSLPAGINPVLRIEFLATQDGTPVVELFDPLLLLPGDLDAVISGIQYTEAVVTGGEVPEPSTFILTAAGIALAIMVRRRGTLWQCK